MNNMVKYGVGLVLLTVLLLLGVLAAGIYRFNFTHDDLYLELEDGRVVPLDDAGSEANPGSQAQLIRQGPDPVMLKLFSLQTPKAFSIRLPDSGLSVPLSHLEHRGGADYATADYRDAEARGSVLLDYLKITPLNLAPVPTQAEGQAEGQGMAFVAPFVVTGQGSGSFWYLGMFHLNTREATVAHLGSVFIGDRILLDSIEPAVPFIAPYRLSVHYRDRGPQEAMADTPSVAKTLTLAVSEHGITAE
ncbi:hypothetical protein LZP73_02795 [Shewanella sp. AS16]|uniref:hypothetical protein n=1 Tax=Shewanella sp. AS16 TaxID=2907625 RepID=UPI001F1D8ACF|nr:hypothetical protein [Shewanella sp. AS16]MCE9685140.1 hypothetical protein [Shewanella sp. AS16]